MTKAEFRELDRSLRYFFQVATTGRDKNLFVVGKLENFFKDGAVLCIRNNSKRIRKESRGFFPCEMLTMLNNGEELWAEYAPKC